MPVERAPDGGRLDPRDDRRERLEQGLAIWAEHETSVRRVCGRRLKGTGIDPNDAASESLRRFLDWWTSPTSDGGNRERDVLQPRAFLNKIAANVCTDWAQNLWARPGAFVPLDESLRATSDQPDERGLLADQVMAILRELVVHRRNASLRRGAHALVQRRIYGRQMVEIAEKLGVEDRQLRRDEDAVIREIRRRMRPADSAGAQG